MIIHNVLDHILKSKSNIKVLRVLNSSRVGISGRETARLAKTGLRSVQISLYELERFQIVKKQFGGRENLFSLNRENYLVKNIIEKLFREESKFRTTIFKNIKIEIENLTDSIILFGSAARESETVDSDLDVCIVYSKNKREIEKRVNRFRDELAQEFGVMLAPFYIKRQKFKEKAQKGKSPINNVINEGKVISGISINRLVHG